MRHRVTLWIALAVLSACAFTDLDGYSGGTDAKPDGGDSGPTNTSSGSSSNGSVVGVDDAATDAGDDVTGSTPDAEAGVDAAPPGCVADDVLVGNNLLAPINDGIAPLALDAYGYTAAKAGTGHCIWLYIQAVPPSEVVVGVYSNADAQTLPTKLLAEAVFLQPKQGWNSIALSTPVTVKSGTIMWIGVTALKSGMEIRETESDGCGALYLRAGSVTGTTHAPTTFSQVDDFPGTCGMSAYVSP